MLCVFGVFGVQSDKEYLILLNIVQKKERKTFKYSNRHSIINHQEHRNNITETNDEKIYNRTMF